MLNLSWICFENECPFSYLFQLLENPNYKMGDNTELEDFKAVIGVNATQILRQFIVIAYFVNLIFILSRASSTSEKLIVGLVALTYFMYIRVLDTKTSQYKQQSIHLLVCTVALAYFSFGKL